MPFFRGIDWDVDPDAAAVGRPDVIVEDLVTYHFPATKTPGKFHTVHLLEWGMSGKCSCEDFDIRREGPLLARVIRPHSAQARCKHIDCSDQILALKAKKLLAAKLSGSPNPNTRTITR